MGGFKKISPQLGFGNEKFFAKLRNRKGGRRKIFQDIGNDGIGRGDGFGEGGAVQSFAQQGIGEGFYRYMYAAGLLIPKGNGLGKPAFQERRVFGCVYGRPQKRVQRIGQRGAKIKHVYSNVFAVPLAGVGDITRKEQKIALSGREILFFEMVFDFPLRKQDDTVHIPGNKLIPVPIRLMPEKHIENFRDAQIIHEITPYDQYSIILVRWQ